jgi:hypothetical protein
MACDKADKITFAVYELYPDGREFDTGRTFTIDKDRVDYYIVADMFNALYNYSIGPNGFQVVWDKDEAGNPKRHTNGFLHWAGPRPPAQPIGGNWWRIKRVV